MSDPGATGSASGSSTATSAKETATQAKDEAKEVTSTAAEQTREVAGTAREGARQVATETGQQLGVVTKEASAQAQEMLSQATTQLREQAATQTERAAGGLRQVATQLQALSDGKPDEAGAVGDYARQATQKLGDVATRLDEGGFDGALDDLQRFARRRPGLFLLGAAGAGFVVGRLLRGAQAAGQQGEVDEQRPSSTLTDGGTVPLAPSSPAAALSPGAAALTPTSRSTTL